MAWIAQNINMPKFIYRWHKTLPSFYFCLHLLSPVFPQFILFVFVCLCWLTAAAVSGISDGFLSAFGSECLQTHSLIKQVILKQVGFDRKRDTNCVERRALLNSFARLCLCVHTCRNTTANRLWRRQRTELSFNLSLISS